VQTYCMIFMPVQGYSFSLFTSVLGLDFELLVVRFRTRDVKQNLDVKRCTKFYILCNFIWYLKVPKREIFDRSDFPDFCTMKALRVGDFGVKIKKIFKNI
jgi:hypothetical protein